MTREPGPSLPRRFRFAGVEVDEAAHRVRVDVPTLDLAGNPRFAGVIDIGGFED